MKIGTILIATIFLSLVGSFILDKVLDYKIKAKRLETMSEIQKTTTQVQSNCVKTLADFYNEIKP